MPPFPRDPISEQFDGPARRLLERAYANRGDWTGTYLAQPSPLWRAWALAHGIDLTARDRWGEIRWVRAFKRSVYWSAGWYGYAGQLGRAPRIGKGDGIAVVWQTGNLVYKTGWPARRWAIRIKLEPGGLAAEHAVRGLPPARRYTEDPRLQSQLEDRDWSLPAELHDEHREQHHGQRGQR